MKNLLLITLFTISVFFASAQQTTDLIFLKNGSVIKGAIIEKSSEIIKIETCCGSTFVYKLDEIDRTETINEPLPGGYLKSSGYYNYTSMGLLLGSGANDYQAILSIQMEHNYNINQYFAIGAVMGFEVFNETVAPIGINVKGLLPTKGKSNLFTSLSAGYLIPIEKAESINFYEITETKGGIFLNSEIGIIIPSKSNSNLFIAIGYRYNELNYIREDWSYGEVKRKVTYNRFVLKVGICLH